MILLMCIWTLLNEIFIKIMKYKFFAVIIVIATLLITNLHNLDIPFYLRLTIYSLILIFSLIVVFKIIRNYKKYDFIYIFFLLVNCGYVILKFSISVTTLNVLD